MDFSRFNSAEQAQINAMIEQKQMKDFLKMYQNLVERCFNDCINDFTSKAISSKEETCINRCAAKILNHSERVGARFGELNQQLMGQQQ